MSNETLIHLPSPTAHVRMARGALWAFLQSLDPAAPSGRVARLAGTKALTALPQYADETGLPLADVEQALREVARMTFSWLRGGRGDRPGWMNPPESLELESISELLRVLRWLVGDGVIDAIDSGTRRGGTEPMSRAILPGPAAHPVAKLVSAMQVSANEPFARAAAASQTNGHASDAPVVIPGWDVEYGNWIIQFLSFGKHIFLKGPPAGACRTLIGNAIRYELNWQPELEAYRVTGITNRELFQVIAAVRKGDPESFRIE
jgi:hypothetical protein